MDPSRSPRRELDKFDVLNCFVRGLESFVAGGGDRELEGAHIAYQKVVERDCEEHYCVTSESRPAHEVVE